MADLTNVETDEMLVELAMRHSAVLIVLKSITERSMGAGEGIRVMYSDGPSSVAGLCEYAQMQARSAMNQAFYDDGDEWESAE